MIAIQEMQSVDTLEVAHMARLLYGEEDIVMLQQEFKDLLSSEKDKVFVAKENDNCAGFLHMALRYEYVEGAASSPIGYMEGIYVNATSRHQHVAQKLTLAGEEWAKSKGCSQLASDVELDNTISQTFHHKVGFKEVNRLVCYIKEIDL